MLLMGFIGPTKVGLAWLGSGEGMFGLSKRSPWG